MSGSATTSYVLASRTTVSWSTYLMYSLDAATFLNTPCSIGRLTGIWPTRPPSCHWPQWSRPNVSHESAEPMSLDVSGFLKSSVMLLDCFCLFLTLLNLQHTLSTDQQAKQFFLFASFFCCLHFTRKASYFVEISWTWLGSAVFIEAAFSSSSVYFVSNERFWF